LTLAKTLSPAKKRVYFLGKILAESIEFPVVRLNTVNRALICRRSSKRLAYFRRVYLICNQ
jgi:hypothetical protein